MGSLNRTYLNVSHTFGPASWHFEPVMQAKCPEGPVGPAVFDSSALSYGQTL